jgi:hypothetical protein
MKRIVDILRNTDDDKVLSRDVDASANSTVPSLKSPPGQMHLMSAMKMHHLQVMPLTDPYGY